MGSRASASAFATLSDALAVRSLENGDALAFRWLSSGGEVETLRYADLEERSRAIAVELVRRELTGRTVLIVLPPSLSYVVAVWACLRSGAIAVPTLAPARRNLARTTSLAQSARAAAVLSTERIHGSFAGALGAPLGSLPWIDVEAPRSGTRDALPVLDADGVAIVQYTSGTTSDVPRGVVLRHRHVLANLALIREAFEVVPSDHGALWLPPHHDMGLVGGVLGSVVLGVSVTLLSPAAFIQRPIRWLRAISSARATIAGAPDFAYALCVARTTAAERAGLDLSHWRVAFDGAEPVRAETLARFAETFAPHGFRPSAFRPVYGLAESTLIVAGRAPRGEATPGSVSCGSPLVDVRVVDPDTLEPVPDGGVGEIWVRSESNGDGYLGLPAESQATFAADTADGEGPFLRTGDLGRLEDGELFVVGRCKEIVVIAGRNLAPNDVERSARDAHPAIEEVVAFGVPGSLGEELIVHIELRRRTEHRAGADLSDLCREVETAARRSIVENHEVAPELVAVVASGTIERTTSGKLRRVASREKFVAARRGLGDAT